MHQTRRSFLATVGSGLGFAGQVPAASQSPSPRFRPSRKVSPTERISVGCIGVGSQGQKRMTQFIFEDDVDVVALCDVDSTHLETAAAYAESYKGKKPKLFRDFRRLLEMKEIDAVVVTTPDHWHALPFILACEAGKDVFVEKPLCHNIAEGRLMLEAARRHKRISQLGNQVHNDLNNYRRVVEVIQAGLLGTVTRVNCWMNYANKGFGHPGDCDPPPTLDYEFWLGPAPKRPYNPNRSHNTFRYFWDYSGGVFIDFWCHITDVAYWALDLAPPRKIQAIGGRFVIEDNTETPDTMEATYEHSNKLILNWTLHRGGLPGFEHMGGLGCVFQGSEATLVTNYKQYEVYVRGKKEDMFKPPPQSLPDSPGHIREFLDSVKSRQKTTCDVEYAYRLTKPGLLGNIAFRTGETIHWDDEHERIENSTAGNQLLSREYRPPWKLGS